MWHSFVSWRTAALPCSPSPACSTLKPSPVRPAYPVYPCIAFTFLPHSLLSLCCSLSLSPSCHTTPHIYHLVILYYCHGFCILRRLLSSVTRSLPFITLSFLLLFLSKYFSCISNHTLFYFSYPSFMSLITPLFIFHFFFSFYLFFTSCFIFRKWCSGSLEDWCRIPLQRRPRYLLNYPTHHLNNT